MKGKMESKRGGSNQRAYAPTCHEDGAAQRPPPLASAPSICGVCAEYKPTPSQKRASRAEARGDEDAAARLPGLYRKLR